MSFVRYDTPQYSAHHLLHEGRGLPPEKWLGQALSLLPRINGESGKISVVDEVVGDKLKITDYEVIKRVSTRKSELVEIGKREVGINDSGLFR